ncbi:GntR family transcriptional regulator [Acuticoccus sediminis]|uniref:GntR family transcriptional regulator n=1 Tax=Acuticoccus sediminis TaxID=2184697 RepID=UPI00246802B9|nr:GntR family transcriptional regulator [Acuticoccus sediminis]
MRAIAAGPHGTAAGRIYENLRLRIITVEIAPDTVLSRATLAKEYGVSQTPVREALQRLEQDGLVETFPQSRTVVTRIDPDALTESHFLRRAVETEVVRHLAQSHTPETLSELDALIAMQETLIENTEQVAMFYDLDESFHRALFGGIGYIGLHNMIRSRSGHLDRARRLDMPRKEKMREIVDGHIAIAEAVRASDPEAAAVAMREHLSGTLKRIEMLRQANPDAFDTSSR